jgi:hypothetical protein
MYSRIAPFIARAIPIVIGLVIGIYALAGSAISPARAAERWTCKIPLITCAAQAEPETPRAEAAPPEVPEVPEARAFQDGIPIEELSLYKTLTYVPAAAFTDQLWYLIIASEAATTGPIFLVVNASTSASMTYTYEWVWDICCKADPGPDGVVPVSATKAIIYRGLSILRVGALALLFGNTIGSSAVVTTAITVSRTMVYATNDFFWNGIDVRKPVGDAPDVAAGIPTSATADDRPAAAATAVNQRPSGFSQLFDGLVPACDGTESSTIKVNLCQAIHSLTGAAPSLRG